MPNVRKVTFTPLARCEPRADERARSLEVVVASVPDPQDPHVVHHDDRGGADRERENPLTRLFLVRGVRHLGGLVAGRDDRRDVGDEPLART